VTDDRDDLARRAAGLWGDLDPRDPRPLAEQLDARLVVEEAERLLRGEVDP